MHGNDTAVLLLERAAALAVQASIARAAHLRAVAGFVARSRAALGPAPADAFGLEAMDHADAQHAVVSELAARLTITEIAAYKLVALAMTLTTRLPVTFAAFAEGRIDEARAAVVVEQTSLLSDGHAAVVDEAITEALGPLNTAELTAKVKVEVQEVDREAVKRRARKATAARHVRLKALADGMAELSIVAPATVLVPAYNTIEALAKDKDRPGGRVDPHAALIHGGEPPAGPDGTPLDQRDQGAHRADVAVELLRQGLGGAAPSGCAPQVFVTFPAAVGLDDQPAQLDRVGAVPAIFARELLDDHRFRRVLTDPFTGHLVSVDGHSYPAGVLTDLSGARQCVTDRSDDDPVAERTSVRGAGGDDAGTAAPSRRLASATVARPASPRERPADSTGSQNGSSSPRAGHEPAPDAAAVVPGGGCPVAAAGGGRYEPGAAILRFVRARSRRCTAQGCRRPSSQCDTDHRVPWPLGPTCPCNLAPLCRRHHLAKHRFGWAVRKASPHPADPSQHWTSPLGYEYLVAAEPLLPVGTAAALAREREVPTETWPGDGVDRARPYGCGRGDWLGAGNTRQASLALERHAEAHAPPPEPARPPTGGSGQRGGCSDDPPF